MNVADAEHSLNSSRWPNRESTAFCDSSPGLWPGSLFEPAGGDAGL
jgi:hypothetical protein